MSNINKNFSGKLLFMQKVVNLTKSAVSRNDYSTANGNIVFLKQSLAKMFDEFPEKREALRAIAQQILTIEARDLPSMHGGLYGNIIELSGNSIEDAYRALDTAEAALVTRNFDVAINSAVEAIKLATRSRMTFPKASGKIITEANEVLRETLKERGFTRRTIIPGKLEPPAETREGLVW